MLIFILIVLTCLTLNGDKNTQSYPLILQLVTYIFALLLTLMQEYRQISDVWYAQPLLWTGSLLLGLGHPVETR